MPTLKPDLPTEPGWYWAEPKDERLPLFVVEVRREEEPGMDMTVRANDGSHEYPLLRQHHPAVGEN